MSVRVACPACRAMLDVADEHRGKRLQCPACKKAFQIVAEPERPVNTPLIRPGPAKSRPRPAAAKSQGPPRGTSGRPVVQATYTAYYRNRRRGGRRRGWLLVGAAAALILIGGGVTFLVLRPKTGTGSPATVAARSTNAQKPVSEPVAVTSTPAEPKKAALPVPATRATATQATTRSQEQPAPKKSGPAPGTPAPAAQAKPQPLEKDTPKKTATNPEKPAPAAQAKPVAEEPKVPPLQSLQVVRRAGWETVLTILPALEATDAKVFPGSVVFAKQLREWEKKIDVKLPPEQWPALDVDALVSHNGSFWQASFEIAPGDPATFLMHASLLLTAGEATRALQILTLARQRPGIPKNALARLEQLRTLAAAVIQEGNAKVKTGTQRFDAGDRKAALQIYKEALAEWPQNSNAHYELGLALFIEQEAAAGRPVPKLGTFEISGKLAFPPEAVRQLALTRQHDPLQYMAYQGSDQAVNDRLLPMINKVLPRWKKILDADRPVEDSALADFSDGCQEVALDDLALASRQLLAARRNHFTPLDQTFLRTSLQRVAPGPETEATLKALSRTTITVRSLIVPEQMNAPPKK